MSTYTNCVMSSTRKCPLASSMHLLRAATFYHTFWHLVIIIVLATTIQSGYNVASAEYFSSVDSLQKLADVEIGLLKTFRDYLDMRDKEFESYRRFIENIKLHHSLAEEDIEDYLGNPINAFTLIKRLVTDWNLLSSFITQSQSRAAFRLAIEQFIQQKQIPDDGEIKGAAKGLARLQKIYNLRTNDLAKGEINGVSTGTELSWHDCFEIGTNLFDQKELQLAMTWFEVAKEKLDLIKIDRKDEILQRFEIQVIEYLALSNYELGNSQKAIEYIDTILKLIPDHHTKNMRAYITNAPPKQPIIPNLTAEFSNYTRLCQGIQIPEKKIRKLKCSLESRGNPLFLLAPLKVEQLSRSPEVKVYHRLLTEMQINRILNATENGMVRSSVAGNSGGFVSDQRVSQQAWLDHKSPLLRPIYHLVGEITGLDLRNAEMMQVANYGIGGQYEPHYDFLAEANIGPWIGDRIATNMIYLSDVTQGGFTIFPRINVYSRPIKGSMVSWYNLHKSLDNDYRTFHGGCPVVIGSKRIGNIWVRSGFQEFRRPCGLKSDAYKSMK